MLPEGSARVWLKLEGCNPGGSVKDRTALAMVRAEEESGRLRPGGTLVEASSGNTGIGLALIAAARGYGLTLVVPADMSRERRAVLSAYGARLVPTSTQGGMIEAVELAAELAQEHPDFCYTDQFNNPANPLAHETTTGPEVLQQMAGQIDVLVCGVGTGGTITGISRALKARIPRLTVVAVEPAASPVLSGGTRGKHRIEGIGAGFVPRVLDRALIDRVVAVEEGDARFTTRRLAGKEGLLCGPSTGAAVYAAMQEGLQLDHGANIVVIAPDSGERYLSTGLFPVP